MLMYKRIVIIPYKMGSKSARLLRNTLRKQQKKPVLYVSPNSLTYQPRWQDYVINWGGSKEWPWMNYTDKKLWEDVTNKHYFFEKVSAWNKISEHKVNIPEWTTDPNVAKTWGENVVCRTILTGHSGKGIVLGTVVPAPLYVMYKKKRHEYRVHFAKKDGWQYEIIDITQKKKRKGFENVNTKIRNHQNGWIYARENIFIPHDLKAQATQAAVVSDLPFGAVDLIWNEHEDKCYVLEINSAPGIEGTTLQNYVNFFLKDTAK